MPAVVSEIQKRNLNNGEPFSSLTFEPDSSEEKLFFASAPRYCQRRCRKHDRSFSVPLGPYPAVRRRISGVGKPGNGGVGDTVGPGAAGPAVIASEHLGDSGTVVQRNASRSSCRTPFRYRQRIESCQDPMRLKVQKAVSLYHEELENLKKEHERGPKASSTSLPITAAMRVRFYWPNSRKRLGKVPGVEIGDKYTYRAEMCVVGVHCQFINGIDYLKQNGVLLATSIVASGRYPNEMPSPDELIYTGFGENPLVSKQEKVHDQKLIKGNLALFNSKEKQTPVRVIRRKPQGSAPCFVYNGLYKVVDYWKEKGEFLKFVYKFKLTKLPDQTSG